MHEASWRVPVRTFLTGKIMHKFSKGLKFLFAFLWAKLRKKDIPLVVSFLITEKCNLHCPYCFIRFQDFTTPELSTESLIKIIDEFYALGMRYISIVGGEPLLRKDLEAIVTYLHRLNIFTELVTNGTLIATQLNALKKIDSVCISLEADEQHHDHDRGKGTYAQIIRNLSILQENNIHFRFNATVSLHTINAFPHVAELAKQYRTSLTVNLAILDHNKSEARPDGKEIRRFWENVRRLKKAGYPIEKSYRTIDSLIKNADLFAQGKRYKEKPQGIVDFHRCFYGRLFCYIGADGALFPCCHPELYGKKDFQANIFEYGAKHAWEKLVAQRACECCNLTIGCEMNNFLDLSIPAIWESFTAFLFHRKQ